MCLYLRKRGDAPGDAQVVGGKRVSQTSRIVNLATDAPVKKKIRMVACRGRNFCQRVFFLLVTVLISAVMTIIIPVATLKHNKTNSKER
jgi:hypothetical protein